jgi:putative Mn2+ efflux pump MntP
MAAIVALSVGLAMDAAAVSAVRGLESPRIRPRDAVLVGGLFGGFQALMPLLGWLAGSRLGPYIEAWDHWIAFALLAAIGANMLREAGSGEERPAHTEPFAPRVLLLLAVATSIDALAAGITLPLLGAPVFLTAATVGVTTAALSVLALFAGRAFGQRLGPSLEIVGGVVLIALGTKVLVEHLRP